MSPESRISPSSKPSSWICESSSVSLPVTSYVVRVASWIRTSRSPLVFTTSGSSTPASWTLVPVSLFTEVEVCGALADSQRAA